jgi:DNA-binding phage protein
VIKYPFHKLLLYLLAISKFDRAEFGNLLNSYLPSIKFEFEDPFDYSEKFVKSTPIPACVYKGIDDIHGWHIYSNRFKLEDLHAAFNKEQFEDIIFDPDIRRKIDAMSLSPIFRKVDIVREFQSIDTSYIGVYLDSFSDFTKIENKNSYVHRYIGDKSEKSLLEKVLKTSSRAHLQVILGMKSSVDPKTLIDRAASISKMKTEDALTNDDDPKLQSWLKLQVSFAEKLIRMGAGNKSDLDNLIEALSAKPEFEDPVIYTRDQLEIQFRDTTDVEPS